jgi:hypothetical protein
MAVTLNASTSTGLVQSADTSGIITLQNNGTNALTVDSGNLQFNSGYGSVATAYGCRAWVNFNGTGTPAIRASGNVTSITDNGTGDYTVNITTALPDANYSITGTTSMIFGVSYNGALAINTNNTTAAEVAPTTTAFRVATRNSAATNVDIAYINVAIFR